MNLINGQTALAYGQVLDGGGEPLSLHKCLDLSRHSVTMDLAAGCSLNT
jgi:hypothetical protein